MAAIVTTDSVLVVGGTAEAAPALAGGIEPGQVIPNGTFYFDSGAEGHRAKLLGPQQDSPGSGVEYAAGLLQFCSLIGVDEDDCVVGMRAALGERSARADEFPASAEVCEGDLLRFDVSCDNDGYRSDIGRTAVIGESTSLQSDRHYAIWSGGGARSRSAARRCAPGSFCGGGEEFRYMQLECRSTMASASRRVTTTCSIPETCSVSRQRIMYWAAAARCSRAQSLSRRTVSKCCRSALVR
ncbi:M24 family metallopeptidase [Nocardia sp. NPDC059246]|uniref:M24 family metallopeptidase n=1 Tax=unclassified Nocardia TaxID=2637762 RepID=UPI0036B07AB6